MAHEATINARLPETLKRNGSAVLQREEVSPTQLIRSLYRYIEREGKIPECLDLPTGQQEDIRRKRMRVARSLAGTIDLTGLPGAVADANSTLALDVKTLREERVIEKYGDLL